METAIVVCTRDLRVHDNPALAGACAQARQVVPVFVADDRLMTSPSRVRFLADSLADLREALRERGGDLVSRAGDPVSEVMRLAVETNAQAIFIADDVSRYAARRRSGLAAGCQSQRMELCVTPGLTVVPPGALRPAGRSHYRVFTPYWRAWAQARWRAPVPPPATIRLPDGLRAGRLPAARLLWPGQLGPPAQSMAARGTVAGGRLGDSTATGSAATGGAATGSAVTGSAVMGSAVTGGAPPGLLPGGEKAGRARMKRWLSDSLGGYGDQHDDLAGDQTSRLSAYLRFGCISPLELALAAGRRPGAAEFCRQLAWRDFFYQVTAAFPDLARADYRPRGGRWRDDADALAAWQEGRTGVPIVDAGMRQLAAEGFLPNRARMIVASFLTRDLRIDWRHGYRHFLALLADGDVASNAGNWQWVAGTGHNPRPDRVMNVHRQAYRFDRSGDYVRRYVPELAGLDAAQIRAPWQLEASQRRRLNYPAPIIDPHAQAGRAGT